MIGFVSQDPEPLTLPVRPRVSSDVTVKCASARAVCVGRAVQERWAGVQYRPANSFVAAAVQIAVMRTAQWTAKLYVRRNSHRPGPDEVGKVLDATIEVPVTMRY